MTALERCSTCGSELIVSADREYCPVCLLQQGVQPSTFAGNPQLHNWTAPRIDELVERFPHLEILALLGQGGMGAVYKVRQKELDRPAALKVLPDVVAQDATFAERFLREARLLASLSHPHIVTVYEFGQRDGVYFLLMEFIDGVTLRQAQHAEPIRRLSSKEALAVVGQLCDALQFAHDEGVVHRDIKPENILIDKRGRVKIADFGLAKLLGKPADSPSLTRTHQLMGTPAYMAPEQIEGMPLIDHRVDIYSLGVVFYELLTGELPLGRFAPPSHKAELDVRLDEVVLRTLEKEPDRRYQQASQVKTDVESIGINRRASDRETSAGSRDTRHRVSKSLLGFLAGVAIATLVAWVPGQLEGVAWLWLPFQQQATIRVEVNDRQRVHVRDDRAILMPTIETSSPAGTASPMDEGRGGASMSGMGMDSAAMEEDMYGGGGMGGFAVVEPIIVFNAYGPAINPKSISLQPDIQSQVDDVLRAVRTRYVALENDATTTILDDDGRLMTTVAPFSNQAADLEDELWTQLDDLVDVHVQRRLRNDLKLYVRPTEDLAGSGNGGFSEYGGFGGMMSTGVGGSGMTGGDGYADDYGDYGDYGSVSSETRHDPALFGWLQSSLPTTIRIGRTGRWYQWQISEKGETANGHADKGPKLPRALQRFDIDPGPWRVVGDTGQAWDRDDWKHVAENFTHQGRIDWAAAFLTRAVSHLPNPSDLPRNVVPREQAIESMKAEFKRYGLPELDSNADDSAAGQSLASKSLLELASQLDAADPKNRSAVLRERAAGFTVEESTQLLIRALIVGRALRMSPVFDPARQSALLTFTIDGDTANGFWDSPDNEGSFEGSYPGGMGMEGGYDSMGMMAGLPGAGAAANKNRMNSDAESQSATDGGYPGAGGGYPGMGRVRRRQPGHGMGEMSAASRRASIRCRKIDDAWKIDAVSTPHTSIIVPVP